MSDPRDDRITLLKIDCTRLEAEVRALKAEVDDSLKILDLYGFRHDSDDLALHTLVARVQIPCDHEAQARQERDDALIALRRAKAERDELLAAIKAYRSADTLEALALNLAAIDLLVARIEGGAK